eukprot:gene11574-34273_t
MVGTGTEARPQGLLGDNLIPIINRIQDIFGQVTIDLKMSLPQVAVVGSQSSGKSSVLEALLVKTPNSSQEWGEFLHLPGKQFHDFDEIRDEIQAETERVAAGKNVSDKPIRLKIFSPHVLYSP